jgi:hypothetical protein
MSSKRALVLAQNGQVPNDFQEKRALYSLARDDNFKSISDQLKIREKEITKRVCRNVLLEKTTT